MNRWIVMDGKFLLDTNIAICLFNKDQVMVDKGLGQK